MWRHRGLRAILVMLFRIGTFGLNFPIFISTMAERLLHSDARGFSLLSSIMAIGTILGALLAAGPEKPKFASLLAGAGVFGVGCTSPDSPLDIGGSQPLVVAGASAVTLTNGTNSLMQLSTEPAMRGRVMALRVGIALGERSELPSWVGWPTTGPRWSLGIMPLPASAAALVAVFVLTRHKEPLFAQSSIT